MNSHTPGAWVFGDWVNDKIGSVDDCNWVEIWAPKEGDNGLPFIACKHHDQLANARLIAAAPDLLAVCQRLAESAAYWSEYDVPLGIVADLQAAIGKAAGDAQ